MSRRKLKVPKADPGLQKRSYFVFCLFLLFRNTQTEQIGLLTFHLGVRSATLDGPVLNEASPGGCSPQKEKAVAAAGIGLSIFGFILGLILIPVTAGTSLATVGAATGVLVEAVGIGLSVACS